MINFSTLQSLTIPEGNVTKIESGGVVLWENYKPAYAAIYGGDTLVFGRGKSAPESYEGITLTAAFDSVNGYNIETDLYGFDQDWETYTMPWYNYRSNITSIKFIAKVAPIRTSYWFMGLSNCTNWELANLNTSKVEYMAQMFAGTGGLAEDDLLNLNTSKVKNMYGMFQGTSAVSFDLSTWNTSNCTSFGSMFADTYDLKNLNLSGWDTTKATDMSYMFAYGNALESITLGSKWSFTGDGSTNCELPDGNWKHVETSNMYAAADLATGYNGSTMSGTYVKVPPAYAAVYGGDTLVFGRGSSVPESYNGKSLTEGWSQANGYDIENVDYSQIYAGYIGSEGIPWRSYTTYEDSMTFEYFYSPIKSVVFVDSVAPKSTAYWFCNLDMCTNFNLQNLDTSRTTSMQGMFNGCFYMTHLDLSSFDTSSVTNMKAMFYYCHNLNSLDLSSFNTSNVADVKSMFGSCSSLTTLDLSSFNTSSVTNMNSMFSDCSSLTTLDLSGFNTSSVADMRGMFGGCSELATIYASEFWNIGAETLTLGMFRDCNNLKGDIAFDSSYPIDKTYAKTSGGYLTYKAAA